MTAEERGKQQSCFSLPPSAVEAEGREGPGPGVLCRFGVDATQGPCPHGGQWGEGWVPWVRTGSFSSLRNQRRCWAGWAFQQSLTEGLMPKPIPRRQGAKRRGQCFRRPRAF